MKRGGRGKKRSPECVSTRKEGERTPKKGLSLEDASMLLLLEGGEKVEPGTKEP